MGNDIHRYLISDVILYDGDNVVDYYSILIIASLSMKI